MDSNQLSVISGQWSVVSLGLLAQTVSRMSGERQENVASVRSLRVDPLFACFKPCLASGPQGRTIPIARANGPGPRGPRETEA